MAADEDMVRAVREAIAPMWRDTQDRISNLRDSLRKDIEGTEARVSKHIDEARATTPARLDAIEARLADTISSIEKLWERQPVVHRL